MSEKALEQPRSLDSIVSSVLATDASAKITDVKKKLLNRKITKKKTDATFPIRPK